MKILLRTIPAIFMIVVGAFVLTLFAAAFVEGFIGVSSLLRLQHSLGVDTQMSKNYDSVSGYLPMVVTSLGFSGLLITVWHHLNCGCPGCWRIATHHYVDKDGKKHILCHKHDVDPHPKSHWWSKRKGHSLEDIHSRIRNSKISQ